MNVHPKEPTRVELAQLPTPVVELKNLAQQTGVDRILLKRDDLTGLEISGNKVRKLEYVVADALKHGADTLVTHGGFQSNHCRATAAVGARLGLRARMILRSSEAKPELDGNLFLDQLFGADVCFHKPDVYRAELNQIVEQVMKEELQSGRKPYFFPVGASVPYGSWGYARCVAELVEQLGHDTSVDIYCATSSGGTQVGLMLGRALLGCNNWRILGVPVSDSAEYFHKSLRELERSTVEQFSLDLSPEQTPIELVDGFIGEGYAVPFPKAVDTIKLLGRSEGIILDPSYTSKGMTGMLANLKNQPPERLPVYIHTGGAFGMFARRDLLTDTMS